MAGHGEGLCPASRIFAHSAWWLPLLAGCGGVQSALAPASHVAERIASLFWVSVAMFGAIWLAVVALALYAAHGPKHRPQNARRLIIGAGAIFPTAVLTGYLTWGLAMIPPILEPAPEGSLRIQVIGEQWWWRVRYLPPDGPPVDLANEIRLPVGEPVEFLLESPNVIHSFWIPSLGGKIDMIPGRTTRLSLTPSRTGTFRGACAEYCGASHALMSFAVVVQEREDFDSWLALQREPARTAADAHGREVFLASGCGACHTVRGTPANGVLGPDLTHVGGRLGLGADILPNDVDGFVRWLKHTAEIKPEVHMPSFGMLPDDDLQALAAWLDGLE